MASTINASTSSGLVQTADTSGILQFQTNGTATATIDTSGNVGIGTTSPSVKLQIVGAAVVGSATGGGIGVSGDVTTFTPSGASKTIPNYGFGDIGGGIVSAAGYYGLTYYTNQTERMRIDSSGNVGIGTSSPNALLNVNGQVQINNVVENSPLGSITNFYLRRTTNDSRFSIGYTSANDAWNLTASYGSTGAYKPIAFLTSDTERMRIASNGQVLIGTTSNSGRSPPLIISNDSGTTNWAVGPSSGGSTQFYVSAGAGVYLSTTSATSWTANSDINLKNVTGKIENALDAISTLTPARFTWKADETNAPQVGLIAQEVEKVLPEVVDKNADGYLGVRYTEVIPLLVASIQEQQTIITELKSRIEALEGAK
jgi:hypothetical protein